MEYEYKEGAIFICEHCKLQWGEYNNSFNKNVNPMTLHGAVRQNFYKYYINPSSIPSPEKYPPYVSFFELLKAKKPNSCLRILDVGCGGGAFLQECLRRGHDAVGIEADDSLKTVISEKILNRIIFSPVEEAKMPSELFDVITFWDSFEHLPNSFEVLDKIQSCLKKDGIVYLRVNNNRDIVNYFTSVALLTFPRIGIKMLRICFGFPDHAWNFSKIGMFNLLIKKHWKIIHCRFSETPPSRLTKNKLLRWMIQIAYLLNRLMRGGRMGDYYIQPDIV